MLLQSEPRLRRTSRPATSAGSAAVRCRTIGAAVLGLILLVWASAARSEDDIEQYLTLDYSYDSLESLLDVSHGINGITTGLVTTDFDHTLSYDLTATKIAEYQASVSASHEEGLDLDFGLDWDDSWNLTSGISQSIVGDSFDLDLEAEADFEIYRSELGDDFFFDDEEGDDFFFDDEEGDDFFFDDEDEEDTGGEEAAPEWLVDYSLNFTADLDFEPLPAGALELRPSVHAGLDYDSDLGWDYEAAAGIGIALSPAATGRESKSSFASSNVRFSHAGGSFAARPGEVVFAGGRSSTGLYKVAGLIFNEWAPTDTFGFELGAIAEFDYEDGEGLVFDEAELAADATLELAEDWEVSVSAGVVFDPVDAPEYSFSAEISNSTLAAFQPSAEAELELSEGETEVALSFDVTGALNDALSYDFGVSTDVQSDGSIDDVELSFGLDLDGQPLVEDGANSELSFGGSYTILSRELSLDASLSVYF